MILRITNNCSWQLSQHYLDTIEYYLNSIEYYLDSISSITSIVSSITSIVFRITSILSSITSIVFRITSILSIIYRVIRYNQVKYLILDIIGSVRGCWLSDLQRASTSRSQSVHNSLHDIIFSARRSMSCDLPCEVT